MKEPPWGQIAKDFLEAIQRGTYTGHLSVMEEGIMHAIRQQQRKCVPVVDDLVFVERT